MTRLCSFARIGSLLFGVWLTTLPKGSLSLALPMFLISLMWLFFARQWWRSAGRRAFSNRPELQQEYLVQVDERGIRFDGSISSFGWTWPAFTAFTESEKIFLVFVSRYASQYSPSASSAQEKLISFARSSAKGSLQNNQQQRPTIYNVN